MLLGEKHFLGRPVLGLPLPHAPFDGPPLPLPVLAGVLTLEPLDQGLGLERGLPLQQFLQGGPNLGQRIGPGPPSVRPGCLAGQLAAVAVLPCGFAIHACFHRRPTQRCSLVKLTAYFLHLAIRHTASGAHGPLLSLELPM